MAFQSVFKRYELKYLLTVEQKQKMLQVMQPHMKLDQYEGLVWGVIRTAFASVSDLCVVQMQDFLNLGGEARMNFPGTMTDANWTWRAGYDVTNRDLCARIRKLTELYGRLGNQT